jgi:hypothetical protein
MTPHSLDNAQTHNPSQHTTQQPTVANNPNQPPPQSEPNAQTHHHSTTTPPTHHPNQPRPPPPPPPPLNQVRDCVYITDNAYTREEVLRMEQKILKHFGFRVSMPTMVRLLSCVYMRICPCPPWSATLCLVSRVCVDAE